MHDKSHPEIFYQKRTIFEVENSSWLQKRPQFTFMIARFIKNRTDKKSLLWRHTAAESPVAAEILTQLL